MFWACRFRGHDESGTSLRKGNFLTFYEWYVACCPDVAVVALKNAPKKLKLVSSTIQKDIVEACAIETVKAIIDDHGDEYFAILVDESRGVSHKKQMALVIRYVDKRGFPWNMLLDFLMLLKQLLLISSKLSMPCLNIIILDLLVFVAKDMMDLVICKDT